MARDKERELADLQKEALELHDPVKQAKLVEEILKILAEMQADKKQEEPS